MSPNTSGVPTPSVHNQKIVALMVMLKQEALTLQPISMIVLNAIASYWYDQKRREGKVVTAFTVEISETDLKGMVFLEPNDPENQGWVARVYESSEVVAEVMIRYYRGQIELLSSTYQCSPDTQAP